MDTSTTSLCGTIESHDVPNVDNLVDGEGNLFISIFPHGYSVELLGIHELWEGAWRYEGRMPGSVSCINLSHC